MKNNTIAMIATISLVGAIATLIGYIDPATCTVDDPQSFWTCEEAAMQNSILFWTFTAIGGGFLATALVRRLLAKRNLKG